MTNDGFLRLSEDRTGRTPAVSRQGQSLNEASDSSGLGADSGSVVWNYQHQNNFAFCLPGSLWSLFALSHFNYFGRVAHALRFSESCAPLLESGETQRRVLYSISVAKKLPGINLFVTINPAFVCRTFAFAQERSMDLRLSVAARLHLEPGVAGDRQWRAQF